MIIFGEQEVEEETTTSCNEEAAPKEISLNAAMGAVLLDLDDIKRHLNAFLDGKHCFTLLQTGLAKSLVEYHDA